MADIIGEFGYFQFSLTLLTFTRYICAGMMTNTGSLLAPKMEFRCDDPDLVQNPLIDQEYLVGKCDDILLDDGSKYNCSQWAYKINGQFQRDQYTTLTDSFDLICHRDWLRSAYQGSVTIGVVLASVVWGSFSDRYGRLITIKICFIFSLSSGLVSFLAKDYFIFTFARAFCSFGDIGLAVTLVTIIVETLGTKYRGSVCIFAYTGWAIGVMLTPWLTELMHLKSFILFTLICHILTLPWILFTVRESIRWLLVNGLFDEAKEETMRVLTWNSWLKTDKSLLNELNSKFELLKEKFIPITEKQKLERELKEKNWNKFQSVSMSIVGSFSKVGELMKSKELVIVSLTMIWITFNCELFYMTTILVNSDIGNNVKLNYAIGGLMEILASIIAVYLIEKVTRKLSIIGTLLAMSASCFTLALTHEQAVISIYVLNLTKFAVSTLTSVIYVTTTELFPTNLRQTGFGLTYTFGSLGSVVSPFIRTELVKLIGLTRVLLILTALPISAALLVPFYLKETKGVELSDNIDDTNNQEPKNQVEGKFKKQIPKSTSQHELKSPVTTV